MGLFDKIKRTAPVMGAVTATGAAAAAGFYAKQAFADDKVPDDQKSKPSAPPAQEDLKASDNSNVVNPEATSFSTPSSPQNFRVEDFEPQNESPTVKEENSEPQTQVNESPESSYDPETGVTTHRYPNGNILTEYPDGKRAWHDAISKETIVYNPETGESITYEPDGDVVATSPDGSQVIIEPDGDVVFRDPDGTTIGTLGDWDYTPTQTDKTLGGWDCTPPEDLQNETGVLPETTQIFMPEREIAELLANSPEIWQELSTTAQNGTFDTTTLLQTLSNQTGISPEATQVLNDLSTAAQNGTLDSTTLLQTLSNQTGIPLEGAVNTDYEEKFGWEANYNKTYTGSDELAPGVGLNSEASYDANVFAGAYSKGDAGIEWNSEQVHLNAQARSMVGVEASQEANYKGTLEIEGVNYQPGLDVNAYTKGFAGAEVEGQADVFISHDSAQVQGGVEAFAGAKTEGGASGALSVNGDDFAQAGGSVDARAGIGADLGADIGYNDGQINLGMNAGVALGVGVGYDVHASVDAPGIVTHPDAVLESVGEEVVNFGDSVGEEVVNLGDSLADTFSF
jgi:hypothetical protein